MPFKKGPAAWRRTLDYLKSGQLIFREKVKVCSINYHETEPESDGLRRFIFWNLAQIQYKNPDVQCVQFKNIVKTPFISFHTLSDNNQVDTIHVNCYKKNEYEILDYCIKLVGKTKEEIEQEAQVNVANFGEGCSRHCICMVDGQIACPRTKDLPHFMRGKYYFHKKEELDEIRKTKSDEQALKEYWNSV
jgi:small subunit ribosomal protein S25